GSEISHRVKYWIRPDIDNRIKEGAIKAYFNSIVKEITPTTISIHTPEGVVTIENDHVLAMTGYQPDFSFLRKIGIEIADDETMRPTYDPNSHETNMPNIYLAGVVCGGMHTSKWFIENSREHAEVIVKELVHRKTLMGV
ncbi:MAG: NAD(P)-binding domain-containing protein, partial [Flammeovirgaceae bacterium]